MGPATTATKIQQNQDHRVPRWSRDRELAAYLGVTTQTLANWRRDRVFPPAAQVRGTRLTDLNVVDDWLRAREGHGKNGRGSDR